RFHFAYSTPSPPEVLPMPHEAEVHAQTEVPLPRGEAYRRFLEFGRWWPGAYSFAGQAGFAGGRTAAHPGGHWHDADRSGQRLPWGPVRMAATGRRLVLGWGVALDRTPEAPERTSEVDVDFTPSNGGTRVEIRHRQMNRHGEGWAAFHDAMRGP